MAIHVNTNTGETGVCRAKKGQCPFGGESGTENHYDTREEALAAAEKHMESIYKDVHKGYVAKRVDGLGLPTDMKKRLIKEAAEGKLYGAIVGRTMAKDSDELIRKQVAENINSQKLLRDMSDDDSARVRKAVAQRTRNRTVLAKLANDPDAKVRYAAIHNSNTPVKARKAAQAAIREANLRNLQKARGEKAKSETQPQVSENVKNIFKSKEAKKAGRKELAELHGVTIGNIKTNDSTMQIGITKGKDTIVQNADGKVVGTVPTHIYDSMSKVQDQLNTRRVQAKRNGKHFEGLKDGSSVSANFKNAHDPLSETLIKPNGSYTESERVSVRRSGPQGTDHTISITDPDGNTYHYNSMSLRLQGVDKGTK